MTNSNDSPPSNLRDIIGLGVVLLLLVSMAGWYFETNHFLLYYGDAQAHLNISRSWIDSRNPGYDQIGTVWLPLLHLICLPFVRFNSIWQNGLAATIPVGMCFTVAGVSLYLCGKEAYQSKSAALAGVFCFALNPNVLYLASISMTEMVFLAGLTVCLLAILQFRATQQRHWIAVAIVASWCLSLTRYDGWFLVPFIALFLSAQARRNQLNLFFVTGLLAGLAPGYWIVHNWWETGNPLDFYNGPYSAAAIQGGKPYPGFHNWLQALHYYCEAGRLCCGNLLFLVGLIGCLAALLKGRGTGVVFLSLTPLFYVWSVHSSETPIFVPIRWPFSFYNTRYGIAVVLFMAFAVAALVAALPARIRAYGLLLPAVTALPWLIRWNPNDWVCWKESEQNSIARREWTARASIYLKEHYREGQGILMEFGDVTGILEAAGIPLKESLHEGSHATWFANTMPNGLVHQMKWAIAQQGDPLALRLNEGKAYHVVDTIAVKGAPRLFIYERD